MRLYSCLGLCPKHVGVRSIAVSIAIYFACLLCVSDSYADNCGWGLARVSVGCIREEPRHSAELGTQVVMGTPMKILDNGGSWKKVETPDGYVGYIISNSITLLTDVELSRWKNMDRVVVSSYDQTYIYDNKDNPSALERVTDVVNGSILVLYDDISSITDSTYVAVGLPDGRKGYIASKDVEDIRAWAGRSCDIDKVICFACCQMGVPYLWGGTSSKSMDCSGLSKIAFLSQGIILPRNASAQAKVGVEIASGFRKGDLLFFGNKDTGKVNHVGICIGNGRFIHSSGRVRISSLSPGSPEYENVELLVAKRFTVSDYERFAVRNNTWIF